ncbi:ParB N-terminal domain-containing protein [Brevundimonas vesicularis]|uniref:ParB N-terminal domain-containing protein n=1 Tax=Brevundimonas vesicularis TaxID=41276 RepID=UPI0022EC80A8|nr:ParB N-terminal domain-containing protein [Brevundimonas vesicularis]WBT06698.1 ParB N-terminal domain-containing protein [Brevundimonas vesicularis]
MLELNILAVQNADVLRALATPAGRRTIPSISALAALIGRDHSNLSKTLKGMEGAGLLLAEPIANGLTPDGLLQLEAINRAETAEGGEGLPDGLLALRHDQILPDPDNARQDWTSDEAKDELDALRADIVKNGLLQNLVVRPMADDDLQDATITVVTPAGEQTLPRYRLVAGERRWRAIGEAISDGDWEPEEPILARLLDRDAKETRFAAIAENLLRRKLNPIEKAKGFEQLAELGFENKLIAERLGYTPEHVQQHRRFLKLDEADQQRMTLPRDDPKHLSVRDARQKLTAKDARDAAWRPGNLPPEQQLVIAEIAVAMRKHSTYLGSSLAVGPAARDDQAVASLRTAGILQISDKPAEWGSAAGHFTVSFPNWAIGDACRTAWADLFVDDEAKRHASLQFRQKGWAGRSSEGANYLTEWLNGPFDMTPEGQAILDRQAANQKAHEQQAAQRAAEAAEAAARFAAIRQKHLEALNAAAAAPPKDLKAATVEATAAIDNPLPWTLLDNGEVIDANGEQLNHLDIWNPDDRETTFLQVIVVAVNSAAGLATPPIKSAEAHQSEMEARRDAEALAEDSRDEAA